LEEIVDGIDAPLVKTLTISFFHQPIYNTPRLAQLIGGLSKLKTCNKASICIDGWNTSVEVSSLSKKPTKASISLEHNYGEPDIHLSPLVQLCTSSFPQALIQTVEKLNIVGGNFSGQPGQDGVEWRELLRPFTAVKGLDLDLDIALRIAPVLQELVEESVMELLPALQNIFASRMLRPSAREGIEQFIAARQLAGHPTVYPFVTMVMISWSIICQTRHG